MLAIPAEPRPALRFLAPRKPWLFALARPGSWLYLKMSRVRGVEVRNMGTLARLYSRLQEGKIRLIIAFRHAHVDDGTVLFRLMNVLVGSGARRLGVELRRRPRGYFLYGRDVTEWGGAHLGWLFPRMGGISVFPGKFDSESLSYVRRLVCDGDHPVALAPEGQVTYHNERVSRLEPGAAQLAFWCREDLARQGRDEEVMIVPVCASYHYRESDRAGMDSLLSRVEGECGLSPIEGAAERPHVRLVRLLRRVLDTAEDFYARFYGCAFPAREHEDGLQERVERICEAALGVAESFFRLAPKGDFIQRVMSARYAGLSLLHRADMPDPRGIPALEKALAGRIAAESWLRLRHMELADVMEYLRVDYVSPDAGIDRCVEFALNLADVVSRLKGGNISGRPNPFSKHVRVIINEPIPVSPFWDAYRANRRKGVADLTDALLRSLRETAERS